MGMKGWLVIREEWESGRLACFEHVKVFKTKEGADKFVETLEYPNDYFVEEIDVVGF